MVINRNFYVTGSEGQESKSSLAMYFWLRGSHDISVKLLAGLHLYGLTGAGESGTKLTHLATVGGFHSSPYGSLHKASLRWSDERETDQVGRYNLL